MPLRSKRRPGGLPLSLPLDVGRRSGRRRGRGRGREPVRPCRRPLQQRGHRAPRTRPSVVETTDEEWEEPLPRQHDRHLLGVSSHDSLDARRRVDRQHGLDQLVHRLGERRRVHGDRRALCMQFTRALALELAPRGIRANCVCPGVIDTPLTDLFVDAADDPEALRAEYAAVSAVEQARHGPRGRELRPLPSIRRGLVRHRLGARRRRRRLRPGEVRLPPPARNLERLDDDAEVPLSVEVRVAAVAVEPVPVARLEDVVAGLRHRLDRRLE